MMHHTTPHSAPVPRAGFALIVSLSLLAFIVLLLLGLLSFTQVEIQQASNQRLRNQAEQNALLGIQVALGRLQQSAGPDRRTTGPLDADASLTADPSKRHWTGVWKNEGIYDTNRNLQTYLPRLEAVLVSGEQVSSGLADEASGVLLVGPETVLDTDDYIRAPTEAIETTGHMAYWISDQNTKARLNLQAPASGTGAANTEQLSAARYGLELLDLQSNPGTWLADRFSDHTGDFGNLHSLEQLQILLAADPEFADLYRDRFHAITTDSNGLLTNQRRGGLRRDLSWMLRNRNLPAGYLYQENGPVLARSPVPGPAWSLLQDFYDLSASQTNEPPTLTPQEGDLPPDDPADNRNPIGPIVTQIKLYFNFSFNDDGHLRMHLFPQIVLHNPYSSRLAADTYRFQFLQHNTDPATELSVDVEMDDHSTQTFSYRFKDGSNALFHPQHAGNNNGGIYFAAFDLAFDPGEVKILTLEQSGPYVGPINDSMVTTAAHAGNASNNASANLNRLAEGYRDLNSAYVEFQDSLPPGRTPEFYEFDLANSSTLRFRTNLESSADTFLLSHFDKIAYAPYGNSTSDAAIIGSHAIVLPKAGFSYKVELDVIRQLANFNLRGDHFQPSGYADPNQTPSLYTGDFGLGDYSPDISPDNPALTYFGPSHRSAEGHEHVVLFEIPPSDPGLVSLGQLQHLDLSSKIVGGSNPDRKDHNAPSYIFGNSIADPRVPRELTYLDGDTTQNSRLKSYFDHSYRSNEALWDGYFFSTVPDGFDPASDALKNRRLSILDASKSLDDAPHSAAANLIVPGAFNVNSTSTTAWRSLLASLRDYKLQSSTGSQTGIDNLFARFVRPLGQAFESPGETSAGAWQGVRNLSDDQVAELADAIVTQIKARGPFLSLAQFVNRELVADDTPDAQLGLSGTLQAAIDSTSINKNMQGTEVTAPPASSDFPAPEHFNGYSSDFAPGYLSQADLLTLLGPALNARGDTFLIRSYGSVSSPVAPDTSIATAYAEAIVQRIPEKVDLGEAIADGDVPGAFGRKFRIVDFRWINRP